MIAPINRCRGLGPSLGLAAALALAAAAATPGLVVAASPPVTTAVPGAVPVPNSGLAAGGQTSAASFTCPVAGTLTTVNLVPSMVPDPVLGDGADSLLGRPAIATTPADLPAGEMGISVGAPTTGDPSSPLPASSFAAGFAATTELYEVPNRATNGPAPVGSPGAFDASQGPPLDGLPSGTVADSRGEFTGAGLPYAQVFPVVDGVADFGDPLIAGGVPTQVAYQSYATDPSAWKVGDQPKSRCGPGREYALLTFSISPYVGHQLAVGGDYAAYLLVRNTSAHGPLANHLWYFQAAVPAPPPVTLSVVVTNNASGTGTYQQVAQAQSPGTPVNFTVDVSNTSMVEETISSISESYQGVARPACAQDVGSVLTPGAGLICALDPGTYSPPAGETSTEEVTVTVSGGGGTTVTATGDSSVSTAAEPGAPELSVAVVASNDAGGGGYSPSAVDPTANAAFPLRVVARNDGAVPEVVESITESDGLARVPVCAQDFGLELAVGESLACSFTSPERSPGSGQSRTYTLTVTVGQAGMPTDLAEGTSSSSVSTAPAPTDLKVQVSLTNDAAAHGQYLEAEAAPAPGAAIPFRLAITNDGQATEEITRVSDSFGAITLPECAALVGRALTVGATVYCHFTIPGYAAGWGQTEADTATVEVSPPGSLTTVADGSAASSVTTASASPALSVTTTASPTVVTPGQTITYTIRLTNRGPVPARGVQVKDVLSGTANFVVLDGTGGTIDSFAGQPVEPVTKVGVGTYVWRYPTLRADGGTAVVVYRVKALSVQSATGISASRSQLVETATVTTAVGCGGSGCRSVATTLLSVPQGLVRAASTVSSPPPATGAHLPLWLSGALVLSGALIFVCGLLMRREMVPAIRRGRPLRIGGFWSTRRGRDSDPAPRSSAVDRDHSRGRGKGRSCRPSLTFLSQISRMPELWRCKAVTAIDGVLTSDPTVPVGARLSRTAVEVGDPMMNGRPPVRWNQLVRRPRVITRGLVVLGVACWIAGLGTLIGTGVASAADSTTIPGNQST